MDTENWTLEFSNDEMDALADLLDFTISQLHSCSASNSFDGLARRTSKTHFNHIREKITSARGE